RSANVTWVLPLGVRFRSSAVGRRAPRAGPPYLNEKNPLRSFLAAEPLFLLLRASIIPIKLWCSLLLGAYSSRGTPELREPIIDFMSLGSCQKIGLPIVSSAFFRLIVPSGMSEPTRLRTM